MSGGILAIAGGTELTVDPSMTVRGTGSIAATGGGAGTLVNRGRISADQTGQILLAFESIQVINEGTMEAANGRLVIRQPLENTGTIQALTSSRVDVGIDSGKLRGNWTSSGTLRADGGLLELGGLSFVQNGTGTVEADGIMSRVRVRAQEFTNDGALQARWRSSGLLP